MTAFRCVFLPLAVAYAVPLVWCVERWNAPTEYFAHCWLLPPLMALLVWQRRAEWRDRPRRVDRVGWWLLAPALVLHLTGAALMIDSWSAASLVLAVPGAGLLALGRERLRGLWPILWLVLFAIPMPLYVEGRAAFELKEVAVDGGTWLANALGADVVRQGDHLTPRGTSKSLYVAAACGGLRSLLAMLALAYCLAFFTGPPRLVRRLVVLAVAAPLAVTANLLRIAALCLLARHFGVPFAETTGHTIANVIEWGGLVVALLVVDVLVSRRRVRGEAAAAGAPPAANTLRPAAVAAARGSLRRPAIVLWVAAGPLLALSLYRPHAAGGQRAELLPAAIAGYQLQARSPEQLEDFAKRRDQWAALLGTDDFVYREYRDGAGKKVTVTALFHDANWKSVHPPRICIEGSGMHIQADDLIPLPALGDGVRASRIVAYRPRDQWTFVTVSVFGTRDWLSGSYAEFFDHHLPLALWRQNQSGFLVRVEAPVYPDERVEQAQARSAVFAALLVPLCRELLP